MPAGESESCPQDDPEQTEGAGESKGRAPAVADGYGSDEQRSQSCSEGASTISDAETERSLSGGQGFGHGLKASGEGGAFAEAEETAADTQAGDTEDEGVAA